jgi:hypothetical protein
MPVNPTVADGAEFLALIEEMPDGERRASGVVRLDKKSEIIEQSSGIEMSPTNRRRGLGLIGWCG